MFDFEIRLAAWMAFRFIGAWIVIAAAIIVSLREGIHFVLVDVVKRKVTPECSLQHASGELTGRLVLVL